MEEDGSWGASRSMFLWIDDAALAEWGANWFACRHSLMCGSFVVCFELGWVGVDCCGR